MIPCNCTFRGLAAAVGALTLAPASLSQTQLRELTHPDDLPHTRFGISAAIDGDFVAIGADGVDKAVFLFDFASGLELGRLLPSDPHMPKYGWLVGMNDHTIAVSAYGTSSTSGKVVLYDRGSLTERAQLEAPVPVPFDHFGFTLAVDGDLLAVGAPIQGLGQAYLYDTTTELLVRELLATDSEDLDRFGSCVAVRGSIVAVSAQRDDDLGTDSGSAYLFDAATGVQLHKLLPVDGEAGLSFGFAIALSDTKVAVSGVYDFSGFDRPGRVYVFDLATGQQLLKLQAPYPVDHDEFGGELAFDGDKLLVTAPSFATATPSFYVFDAETGELLGKGVREGGDMISYFGNAIAADDSRVVVGAFYVESGNGAAQFFTTAYQGMRYCASQPNSTGDAARITACGTPSISANEFGLSAFPIPNQPYLFLVGNAANQVPFGDGFLCIGSGLRRLGAPRFSDANLGTLKLDLPRPGITVAGTYYFQCWFRDPAASGAGFNTSDALEVTFTP